MAQGIEQFEEQEKQKPTHGEMGADDVLRKMEDLVKNPEWRQYMSEKIAAEYEYFLQQQGSQISMSASAGGSRMNQTKAIKNPQELRQTYEFMQRKWGDIQEMKKRITGHTKQAIKDKVITEKDRGFYKKKMKKNVVNGEQIVTKEILEKAERELLESLDKRRGERGEYDDLVNGLLVQNGFLHVDKNNKIPVVDEDNYLKMSVPDRRKWLEKIRDAKPKAEKYLNEGLNNEYADLLEEARREGWIGKSTIKKFKEDFNKIDFDEKKHWIEEMKNGNQLDRYKKLWEGIRKTLDGEALSKMETLREQMGYSKLSESFENILDEEYGNKLEKAFDEGWISRHTQREFEKDMAAQPLSEKQRYLKSFDQEIGRYKILRTKIDVMKNGKEQAEINQMYESQSYGYTEINQRYQELTGGGEGAGSQSKNEMQSILENVQNRRVRKNIEWSEEALRQNKDDKEKMITYLEDRIRKNEETDYAKDVKDARLKKVVQSKKTSSAKQISKPSKSKSLMDSKAIAARRKLNQNSESEDQEPQKKSFLGKVIPMFGKKKDPSKRELDDIEATVKPMETEEDMEEEISGMEEEREIKVDVKSMANDEYETTIIRDKNEKTEINKVFIDDKRGMHHFLHQTGTRRQDHFMAYEQGESVELSLEEIRLFRDYLKESLSQKEIKEKAA